MNNKLRNVINRKEHPAWVVCNQLATRSLVAIKFFMIATLLGPSAIGLAGVGLLAIAIAEALTDTGLPQAIIQQPLEPDKSTLVAVLIVQVLRGFCITFVLLLISLGVGDFFNTPDAQKIVALAAAIPLIRSCLAPSYYVAQRHRNFRAIALVETVVLTLDLIFTLIFYREGFGASAIILGAILSDACRVIIVWIFFKFWFVKPAWSQLTKLTEFGRWIWGVSVVTMIINQFDKIVVAKMLGTTSFGSYQMASKTGQLFYGDLSTMFAQYLFPSLSRLNAKNPKLAHDKFLKYTILLILLLVGISISLSLLINSDMLNFLPNNWHSILPVIFLMIPLMFLGAINGVFSAYLRAVGLPKLTTVAILLQGCVSLPLVYLMCKRFGLHGVIFANTLGMTIAAISLLIAIFAIGKKAE